MLPSNRRVENGQDRQDTVHSANGEVSQTAGNDGFSNGIEIGNAFSSATHAHVLPVQRTDRLRRAVNLTCRAIIRGYDKDAILSECCRYLVDEGGYKVAWAGLSADDEPARIVPKAHVVLTLAMNGAQGQAETTETVLQAAALSCIQKRSPQVVRPAKAKTPTGDPSPLQSQQRLLTVCAVPMELGPHGQGALALGIDDPEAFKAEEVSLLRDLAIDLGHGISMVMDRAVAEEREDRLVQDREFHASLFNHTPQGAFVATTGGRLVQANPAFARLLGYADAKSLLADPAASMYTIIAPRDKDRLMAALEDDDAPRTHDVQLRRKDLTSARARVTVHPVHGPQRTYLQAFVHELSESQEKQSQTSDSAATVEEVQTSVSNGDAGAANEQEVPTRRLVDDPITPDRAPEPTPLAYAAQATSHTSTGDIDEMRCALKNAVTPILNHAELLAQRVDKKDEIHNSVMVINRNASHAAELLHAMDAAMAPVPQTDPSTTAPTIASFLRKAMDDYRSATQNSSASPLHDARPGSGPVAPAPSSTGAASGPNMSATNT